MSTKLPPQRDGSRPPEATPCFDAEVAELTFLLPGWQAAALEEAAQSVGMTTGQILRKLIQDFLVRNKERRPSNRAGNPDGLSF
jgi:hypothetical protein